MRWTYAPTEALACAGVTWK